jgi:hypothetical protein
MKKLYYMVGIKGRDMPNREDWYHYLDCIYASNPDEAVKAYFKQKRNRFEDLDKELIEVYDVLAEYETPYDYLINRRKIS